MAKTCTYCPLGEGEAILENLIVTEVWLIPVFPHPAPPAPTALYRVGQALSLADKLRKSGK